MFPNVQLFMEALSTGWKVFQDAFRGDGGPNEWSVVQDHLPASS